MSNLKQQVIFFIVLLVMGAAINGLLMTVATYSTKAGILTAGMAEGASGMRRPENIMPDMKVVDAYRRAYFMRGVDDKDNTQATDFPMQSFQY